MSGPRKHEPQNAMEAARERAPSAPKRFYEKVSVANKGAGFAVLLDGKPAIVGHNHALVLPNEDLAHAIAGEWRAQTDYIERHTMALSRLAHMAFERAITDRDTLIGDIVNYAGSDLLCYRAQHPDELVALQISHWEPILNNIEARLKVSFKRINGINNQSQPIEITEIIYKFISETPPFSLAALHAITSLTGSALIACALLGKHVVPEAAWAAAHVDEDWQISQWGEDDEARARRAGRLLDFNAACAVLRLC